MHSMYAGGQTLAESRQEMSFETVCFLKLDVFFAKFLVAKFAVRIEINPKNKCSKDFFFIWAVYWLVHACF